MTELDLDLRGVSDEETCVRDPGGLSHLRSTVIGEKDGVTIKVTSVSIE